MWIEGEAHPLWPKVDHPFWVRRGKGTAGDWIEAADMQVGDIVETINGKWRHVLSIIPLPGCRSKWLAALGRFLLGEIDKKSLEPLWLSEARYQAQRVLPRRKWLTEFYGAVLEVGRGDISMDTFCRRMRLMVDSPDPEWRNTKVFVEILSNPEFFIARSEASKGA